LINIKEHSTKISLSLLGIIFPVIALFRDVRWKEKSDKVALLSFDVDYNRDEESISDILSVLAYETVVASFACVGKRVACNPSVYRSILANGHEILNHSYSHPDNPETCPNRKWRQMSRQEKKREVEDSQKVISDILGYQPTGFRMPHFGNVRWGDDSWYYQMLEKEGIRYSSSKLDFMLGGRSAVVIAPTKVIEIPVTTCPYHPYTAMDSYHVFRSKRLIYRLIHGFHSFKASACTAMEYAARRGLIYNVYLDPLDVGHILGDLIQYGKSRGWTYKTYSQYLSEVWSVA
jgi:hypothetical protein